MLIEYQISRDKGVVIPVYVLAFCLVSIVCYAADSQDKTGHSKEDKGQREVVRKFYEDGSLRSEIPMVDGSVDGLLRVYRKNGEISILCPYTKGKEHGLSRDYVNNGKLCWTTQWRDGKKHGAWKFYGKNRKNIGVMWYWRGQKVSRAEFLKKKKDKLRQSGEEHHSLDIEYMLSNRCFARPPGEKAGESKETERKGMVSRKFYDDGSLQSEKPKVDDTVHGIVRKYHKNGGVASLIPVNNGKKDGCVRIYDHNGRLLETREYRIGKKHGVCKTYGENRQIKQEQWYWHGQKLSQEKFLKRRETERRP